MIDDDGQFEITIYFVDTTYGKDSDQWEAESAALKTELEAEYGLPLQYDDIGPGWSFPTFAVIISEYWPAGLIALFFAGEKIEKNLEAWPRLYNKLKSYLARPVYLDRLGASVLAADAVIAKCQPISLKLTGYFAWPVLEGEPPQDASTIVGIADAPERKFLSTTVHVFQITADDKSFKVFVRGSKVQIIDMALTTGSLPSL